MNRDPNYLKIGNFQVWKKKPWLYGTADWDPKDIFSSDQKLLLGVNTFNHNQIVAQIIPKTEMDKSTDPKIIKERLTFIQNLNLDFYPKILFISFVDDNLVLIYEPFKGTCIRKKAFKGERLDTKMAINAATAIIKSYLPFVKDNISHGEIK